MNRLNKISVRTVFIITAVSLCLNVFLFARVAIMDKHYSEQLTQINSQLSSYKEETQKEISKTVWELEEIINRQSSMISDFNYHIEPVLGGKVKLMLSAHLKSHKDGQISSFTVDGDGSGHQRILTTLSDNILTSQVVLPLYQTMAIGLSVSDQYSTKTETLLELPNGPQGLTSHLTITPSISMSHTNTDASARVSGEIYLINEKGTQQSRSLKTHFVELIYNGRLLHTIPFELHDEFTATDGDELYYASILPYPIPIDSDGTLTLVAKATDMEGFSYSCIFEEYKITAGGKFSPVSNNKVSYFTIEN